jgi:predicted DNA-binding protein
MSDRRLEVRLDAEHSRKLDEIVYRSGRPVTAWVKEVIDQTYEALALEERRQAVRRIADAAVEDVPEPEVLARELEKAHEPGRVH